MSKKLKRSTDFQAYIRGIVTTQLHELDISHEHDIEESGMPEEGQHGSWNFNQYLNRFDLNEEQVIQNVTARAIKKALGTQVVDYFLAMKDSVNEEPPVSQFLQGKKRGERWEFVGKSFIEETLKGKHLIDFNISDDSGCACELDDASDSSVMIYFDWSRPENDYITFVN